MGIMSRDGCRRSLRDQSLMIGIIIATNGVLFMNALMAVIGQTMMESAPRMVAGRPNTDWASQSMPPVSLRPRTTMKSSAMVIRPSLLKPANASDGVSTPIVKPSSDGRGTRTSTMRAAESTASAWTSVRASVTRTASTTSRTNRAAKLKVEIAP